MRKWSRYQFVRTFLTCKLFFLFVFCFLAKIAFIWENKELYLKWSYNIGSAQFRNGIQCEDGGRLVAWEWENQVVVFKCYIDCSTNFVLSHISSSISFVHCLHLQRFIFLNTPCFLVGGLSLWWRFPVRFSVASVCLVDLRQRHELPLWLALWPACRERKDVSPGRAPYRLAC